MDDNIQSKIERYSQLLPEERLEVEQYVSQHPEFESLLREAQAFEVLFRQAGHYFDDPPSDEALVYYAATRRFAAQPLPPSLQELFERLESQIGQDSQHQARLDVLEQRLEGLETEDPLAQFERLAGYSATATVEWVAPGDKQAATLRLVKSPWWWCAAAVIALVGLYGVLLLASLFMQSPLDRLATFEETDFSSVKISVRSSNTRALSAEDRFEEAQQFLRDAEVSFLGLFPHFDEEKLEQAALLLQSVIEQQEEGSPLQSNAYHLLGKTRLAQGDVVQSREALQKVVDYQGPKAPQSQYLIDDLSAIAP